MCDVKLIIAGGRRYLFTDSDVRFLDSLVAGNPVTEVVCGMQTGADACGWMWALCRGIPRKPFHAEGYGSWPACGPIRNGAMAAYADAVVLFPGGTGTADMARKAHMRGLIIYDRRTP